MLVVRAYSWHPLMCHTCFICYVDFCYCSVLLKFNDNESGNANLTVLRQEVPWSPCEKRMFTMFTALTVTVRKSVVRGTAAIPASAVFTLVLNQRNAEHLQQSYNQKTKITLTSTFIL